MKALETLEKYVMTTPKVQAPDWALPFELMTDSFRELVGVVLGPWKDRRMNVIHCSHKTLNKEYLNYKKMEKELLIIVFAFEKTRTYLLDYKMIVDINHATINSYSTRKHPNRT